MQCRYCLEETPILRRSCACNTPVHNACLTKWREVSGRDVCEICKVMYASDVVVWPIILISVYQLLGFHRCWLVTIVACKFQLYILLHGLVGIMLMVCLSISYVFAPLLVLKIVYEVFIRIAQIL